LAAGKGKEGGGKERGGEGREGCGREGEEIGKGRKKDRGGGDENGGNEDGKGRRERMGVEKGEGRGNLTHSSFANSTVGIDSTQQVAGVITTKRQNIVGRPAPQ